MSQLRNAAITIAKTLISAWQENNHADMFIKPSEFPWCPVKKGSSLFTGEGRLDLQKEIGRVTKAVGHALDDLDAVIHALKDTGVHGVDRRGQNAAQVFPKPFGETDDRFKLTFQRHAIPTAPTTGALDHRGRKPHLLELGLEQIDQGQWGVRRQKLFESDGLLVLEVVAVSEHRASDCA
jgi:hypothetical protein